jgi:hypothetical protein
MKALLAWFLPVLKALNLVFTSSLTVQVVV